MPWNPTVDSHKDEAFVNIRILKKVILVFLHVQHLRRYLESC